MMQFIKWRIAFVFIALLFAFSGCSDDDTPASSSCDLLEFKFLKSDNSGLSADCTGVISGNIVSVEVPSGTDVTALKASFRSNGKLVRVNSKEQTSGSTVNNFTSSVAYIVVAEDGTTKTYTVSVISQDDRENPLMSSFKFSKAKNPGLDSDVVFEINNTDKTLTAFVSKWMDVENPDKLIPEFTVSTDAVVYVSDTKQVSGTTNQSFKDEVTYTVKYENTDKATEYKVRFLCPQINGTLPVMRFSVPLEQIRSKEDYEKSKLEIIGNGITEGLWTYDNPEVEIRLRGNSTMGLPKKPFRVKFPDKVSPLGLNHATEKNWVLLANDGDKTLLRNAVAFAVSRTLLQRNDPANYHNAKAVLFTPVTKHVDVYVGDEYQGVYHLTDQVQRNPGRVDLEKPGKTTGTNDITGGYMIEIDGFANSEFCWFGTTKGMKMTLKYPDLEDDYSSSSAARNDTRYKYISEYVNTAESTLFGSNYQNATSGWRQYFDEATLVDYYLIAEFTGNPDSWWSTYIYKLRDSDSKKIFFGPVWDFDIAFDNDSRYNNAVNQLMLNHGHDPRTWVERFFSDPKLKAAVKARWNEMKDRMKANALAAIDKDTEEIYLSRVANFKVWDITKQNLGNAKPGPANYEEGIATLKKYINDRYTYLDGVFNGW